MITHTIKKYNEWFSSPSPPPVNLLSGPSHTDGWTKWYKTRHKQGYAEYLNTITWKRGDYLVSQNTGYPFKDEDYFRIVEIQEMRMLVTYDNITGAPECLYLKDSVGNTFWSTADKWFRVTSPPITIEIDP